MGDRVPSCRRSDGGLRKLTNQSQECSDQRHFLSRYPVPFADWIEALRSGFRHLLRARQTIGPVLDPFLDGSG